MTSPTQDLVSTDQLAALRRDLHAHPELCFEEHRTASVVAEQLRHFGLDEVHEGIGRTGVVGILRSGTGPGRIALRADMDALPIHEQNTFAHASQHPGRMHACGHDGHTAMLLGAAARLARERAFSGTVVFIFQPAEEGGGGAREMLRDGLFDRFPVDAVFGLHNWPGLRAGDFAVRTGPVFASSNEFKITIRGKGAHAAMPDLGTDPVPCACQMVLGFQTIITRNLAPRESAVISVTRIHVGEAINAVAELAVVEGTVRTFTTATLDTIQQRMQTMAAATCEAFGTRCEFEFRRNYPPTINHDAETAFVRDVMIEFAGGERVHEFVPTMGAEDFSYLLQARPGCYFVLGNGEGAHRAAGHGLGPCTLHNPSFDFNDGLLPIGTAFWVRLVERWLGRRP